MKDRMRCNDDNDGSQPLSRPLNILEHKEPAGIRHVTECTKRWESS